MLYLSHFVIGFCLSNFSLDLKLSIYKRISNVNNNEELSSLIVELRDRFGSIPEPLNNLFNLIEIKILCIEYNVEQFEFSRKGIVIGFYKRKNTERFELSVRFWC